MDITNSIDRGNLEEYAGAKLKSMLDYIQQLKSEGEESILYPWYIPLNRMKHLEGFKRFIFEGLIADGNHVTDFLPGSREEIGGFMKDLFICWTDEAKSKAESTGLTFKTYQDENQAN